MMGDIIGPFPAQIVAAHGGTGSGSGAASEIYYTVEVPFPKSIPRVFEHVTPQTFRWPDEVRTRGDLMLGKIVTAYTTGGLLVADFIERPDVGVCEIPGGGDSLFAGLMAMPVDQLRQVLARAGAVLA